jgi:MFS family permease
LILKRIGRRPFWGWAIVSTCMIVVGFNAGVSNYANGIFLIPLQQYFHTSRTAIAQAIALTNFLAAPVLPVLGILLDRWGSRRTLLIGLSGLALTLFLLSATNALWQFYVLIIVQQALFVRFNEPITHQTVIGRWFVRLRGRAMGVTLAGVGIFGLTIPALLGVVIEHSGWRSGYLLAGALVAGLALPAVLFFMLNDPSEVGQYADGAAATPTTIRTLQHGATFAEAIRSPILWTLALTWTLCYIEHGVMSLQAPAMFQDAGLSVSGSARYLSFMLGVSIIGRLGIGNLADRFNRVYLLSAALICMAMGALMMLWPAQPLARLGYVVFYGIGSGGVFTVFPVTVQSFFGLQSFGRIYSVVIVGSMLSTGVGNYLGARIYDWRGSYDAAIWVSFAAATLAAALALTLRRRSRESAKPAGTA